MIIIFTRDHAITEEVIHLNVICFNTSTIRKSSSLKIRNVAAPGSLLKVWEGALDVGASLQ